MIPAPDPADLTPESGPAYEVAGQRVTRERFYAVACDPQRSVAVEACAGAGKTWMLVSRIVRALLAGVPAHEILAITFTRKAAGEMRGRLQAWAHEFARMDPPDRVRALRDRGVDEDQARALAPALQGLQARLQAGGRPVQVRTFHSWFAALLRSAPLATLEALGLPAGGELLEDDTQAVARVWRLFQHRVAQEPALRQDFDDSVAAHGRSQTRKALEAALDKRLEFALADAQGVVDRSVQPWQAVDPLLAGTPPAASPTERITGSPWRDRWLAAAGALGRARQPSYAQAGSRLEQAVAEADWPAIARALLTADGEPRKFSETLEDLALIREAQALAQRVQAAQAQHGAWLHQGRMARLSRVLLQAYADLKREQGWVDMSDVERAALQLLSDPVLAGWVQERLDSRISQLLIDEFQDTNPMQWQALHAWLSGYAGAGGRVPSVFIVGDPKQSIYRFRRAEPQVFRAAQRFVVEALGGVRLGCDHTRRNTPVVLAAVNTALGQAQSEGAYDGFRAHTTEVLTGGQTWALPVITRDRVSRPLTGPQAPAWRDSLHTPRELPEERLLALECQQAARWVAQQIAEGLAPGEVMVLARKRDRLVAMEQALRALGLPAQQAEKTPLHEAAEVQDLVALLDVLVSPSHNLSLARVLKSPLVGASDDELAALALRARHHPSWLEALLAAGAPHAAATADLSPRLQAAAERLARWQGWVAAWPPHDALDAIYQDADLLARYAAVTPAPARDGVLARLRALLQASLQVEGGRFLSPYALVRALRTGGLKAPARALADAVQLLTVHGAKGLEARLVLLLDTDAAESRAETMGVVVDWPGQASAPRRFAFIAHERRPPACCEDLMRHEHQARAREELNALYVAMTRAREVLVVSSVEPHRPAAGSWWQRLQGCCERLAPAPEIGVPSRDLPGGTAPAPYALRVVPGPVDALARATGLSALPAARAGLTSPPGVDPPVRAGTGATQEPAARVGEALHRLLEGVTLGALPGPGVAAWPAMLLRAVAAEFGLPMTRVADAVAMADRILRGEGGWAWDPTQVAWAENEVPLHHGGLLLRIDRLVQRRTDGQWWVLDYKSAAHPHKDEALMQQLRRYRQAVQACHPQAAVQAAFLTGQGRWIPL